MNPYKCAPVAKIVILVSMILSRIVILSVFRERRVFGSIVEEGRHPGNTITARGSYFQDYSSLQQETLSDDDGNLDGLAADFIALVANPYTTGIPPTDTSSATLVGFQSRARYIFENLPSMFLDGPLMPRRAFVVNILDKQAKQAKRDVMIATSAGENVSSDLEEKPDISTKSRATLGIGVGETLWIAHLLYG
ncbi:hypothetical protein EDD85DRAFT_1028098 [Armillaria nabsnona]|nr:hypothetical protein EDD85DRAFT_1028098 [Armillaria nabsnona]